MTDIVEKLREVAAHDWRCSHLAHTSDTAKQAANEIEKLLGVMRQVDELYSHAWDRADGGLSMFGSSVAKFEAAHKAVREALGIKLLAYEEE